MSKDMTEFERYRENIRKNNEAAKETVFLLRQIIPEEAKKAVTGRVDIAKLKADLNKRKDFLNGRHFSDPLVKMAYESGRADGIFGTVLFLILEHKES